MNDLVGKPHADWIGVAEAAALVGRSSGTIRHWYRTGQLASRRRNGDGGPFLVDARRVRELAAMPTAAEAAEMVASAAAHEDCDNEIAALRAESAEAAELNAALQHQIESLHAELAEVRRNTIFGSVTSTRWVEESAAAYRGPLRERARVGDAADDLLPYDDDGRR